MPYIMIQYIIKFEKLYSLEIYRKINVIVKGFIFVLFLTLNSKVSCFIPFSTTHLQLTLKVFLPFASYTVSTVTCFTM